MPIRKSVVETVSAVNEQRKRAMARKVVSALDGSIRGKTIAVLGLTFKANTDETRDQRSMISAPPCRPMDPAGMEQAKCIYCDICDAPIAQRGRRSGGDCHRVGAIGLDLARLKSVMAGLVIIDLRNIYRADEMKRANFRYVAVGRGELNMILAALARAWPRQARAIL